MNIRKRKKKVDSFNRMFFLGHRLIEAVDTSDVDFWTWRNMDIKLYRLRLTAKSRQ